jgi:hypothetical protein
MRTVSYFPWRTKIAAFALLVAWFAWPGDGRAQWDGRAPIAGGVELPESAAGGSRHLEPDRLHRQLRQRWDGSLGTRLGPAHHSGADDHDQGDLHRSR